MLMTKTTSTILLRLRATPTKAVTELALLQVNPVMAPALSAVHWNRILRLRSIMTIRRMSADWNIWYVMQLRIRATPIPRILGRNIRVHWLQQEVFLFRT